MLASRPWKSRNRTLTCLMAGVTLSCLLFPTLAFADDEKAPPSGRASGGRGCGQVAAAKTSNVPAVILLSPNQQRGQTVSSRPTFAWFVRDTIAHSLDFRLYEVEKGQFKLLKEVNASLSQPSSGIVILSPLSSSDPPLQVGKRYRWQVEVVCNPNRPSSNLFAEAELDVVPVPPELQRQLTQVADRSAKATLLYQHNLWYDALETVLTNVEPGDSVRNLRRSLIDQIAVNDTERQLLGTSKIHSIQR